MTHYTVRYEGKNRFLLDSDAIRDIRDYVTDEQWNALHEIETIEGVNFALAFMGISGRPFHAFCRRRHLAAYREWMASGPDPVETDEYGFRLECEE